VRAAALVAALEAIMIAIMRKDFLVILRGKLERIDKIV
jgi:hypothetical protein